MDWFVHNHKVLHPGNIVAEALVVVGLVSVLGNRTAVWLGKKFKTGNVKIIRELLNEDLVIILVAPEAWLKEYGALSVVIGVSDHIMGSKDLSNWVTKRKCGGENSSRVCSYSYSVS